MTLNPTEVIPIPPSINQGLTSPSNRLLIQLLGMPRDTIDRKCRGATREPMRSLVITDDVGPFRVTGIKPAVASLKKVMANVKAHFPEVYDVIGSSGMLCVRLIGGSQKISNHAWGCALDINIEGALDGISVGGGTAKRDGKTLAGLAAMAPFFNEEGWYWGVVFRNFEDGMHFEVADETLRKWHEEGVLGDGRGITAKKLARGDKGHDVKLLQRMLAKLGYDILDDGDFGPITEGIVIDFQASNGLEPDGIVGRRTLAKLKSLT